MIAPGRAWAITLVAMAAMAISYIDRQALAVLAPTVTAELHISDTAYGWLGSAFSIAYLLGGPLAGRIIDIAGARRGLPAAIVLWSAVAAAHALAPGYAMLFALRILLGFAEAPTFPAGARTVQRVLAPVDRARGMSMLFAGMSIGSAIAPPLAIGLASRLGWRASFVGVAAVALAWLPLWMVVATREALPDDPVPVHSRMRWQDVLARPAMLRGLVGLVAIIPASTIALQWGAKFLASRHYTAGDYATYLLLSGLIYDVGAIGFGDLASRRARRRGDGSPPRLLLGAAAVLACGGAVGMALGTTTAVIVGGLLVMSIGRGGYVALVNADTLARLPSPATSTAAGLITSVQSAMILISNPVIGMSVDAGGYTPIVIAIGAFVLPFYTAWAVWRAPAPPDEVTAGASP